MLLIPRLLKAILLLSAIYGTVGLLSNIVSIRIVDRVGRVRMLTIGTAGVSIVLICGLCSALSARLVRTLADFGARRHGAPQSFLYHFHEHRRKRVRNPRNIPLHCVLLRVHELDDVAVRVRGAADGAEVESVSLDVVPSSTSKN